MNGRHLFVHRADLQLRPEDDLGAPGATVEVRERIESALPSGQRDVLRTAADAPDGDEVAPGSRLDR